MVKAAPQFSDRSLMPKGGEFFCPRELASHFDCSRGHLMDLIEEKSLKGCVDLRCRGSVKAMWRVHKYALLTFINFRQTKILSYQFKPHFEERLSPGRSSFGLAEMAGLLRCSTRHLQNLLSVADLIPILPITKETKCSMIRVSRECLIDLLNRRLNE